MIKEIGKAAIEGRVVPMSRLKHSAGSGGRGGGGARVIVADEQRNFAARASDCAEVESGSVCPLQHA